MSSPRMFRAPVNWSPKFFAINSASTQRVVRHQADLIERQTDLSRIMINASYNLHPRTNPSGILVIVPGHALVGHNMSSVLVGDEFECQLKCIHTQPCKSFNVHFSSNQANKHVCELNNQTREMKPSDFKARKGSNYYGPVQVSRQLIYFNLSKIFLQPKDWKSNGRLSFTATQWDFSRLSRRHKLSLCRTFITTSYGTQSANNRKSHY